MTTESEGPSVLTSPPKSGREMGASATPETVVKYDPPLKEKGLGKVGRDERLGDPRLIVLVYSTHLVRCPSPLTPSHCTDHSTTDKSSCIFEIRPNGVEVETEQARYLFTAAYIHG